MFSGQMSLVELNALCELDRCTAVLLCFYGCLRFTLVTTASFQGFQVVNKSVVLVCSTDAQLSLPSSSLTSVVLDPQYL